MKQSYFGTLADVIKILKINSLDMKTYPSIVVFENKNNLTDGILF
jgi:hypothetical protein